MAYVAGLLLIDAPASALNNGGTDTGAREGNTVAVKSIRSRSGSVFPYVSAQAFRYWLRETLRKNPAWQQAPVFRDVDVAYTDANPILYWDDDLLGYMRAERDTPTARKHREADSTRKNATPLSNKVVTRISPFRMSTLVSLAPVQLTNDFGVMARHEGDPVPYEHQFYRATLKGLFSLDLAACGTFTYRQRTGFLNLDAVRVELAKQKGLMPLEKEKAYRLPDSDRIERIDALFDGLSRLEGGAKQALHYTDVTPSFLMMAVTEGGNHIFNNVVQADARSLPQVHLGALDEVMRVFKDQVLSPVYVGWCQGYMDDQRENVTEALQSSGVAHHIAHPREVLHQFVRDLRSASGASWLQ